MITASREPIAQQIQDLLHLREYRRQHARNDTQQYGGLGGLTIEGEPGVGKSELVIYSLVSLGYHEKKYHAPSQTPFDILKQMFSDFLSFMWGCFTPPVDQKSFYRLPVSMAPSEKEALLLQAFHEGAVVVIDEINSSPMMERLLNSLLMGKTPDNERPHKPGFCIIGTQNPVTMAGRRTASSALMHRSMASTLPEYSHDEMSRILRQKGVETSKANDMVTAYESQREHAITHHLSPVPTFRDLLRVAKNERRAVPNPMPTDAPSNGIFSQLKTRFTLWQDASAPVADADAANNTRSGPSTHSA